MVDQSAKIHPTAYIHPTAVIGPNVSIGAGSYIGPLCIIGYPAEWKGREGEQDQGVWIGEKVRLTGLVTVDSGVESRTVISHNVYAMKHSHIGHDATIGNGVVISCGAKIGGHCFIETKTNIGLNAVIHQKVTVPPGCMIGACAFIGKKTELKPYRKYAGVPARDIGENIRP